MWSYIFFVMVISQDQGWQWIVLCFSSVSLLLLYQQATSMADSVSVGSDVPENISIDTLNAELEEVNILLVLNASSNVPGTLKNIFSGGKRKKPLVLTVVTYHFNFVFSRRKMLFIESYFHLINYIFVFARCALAILFRRVSYWK